VNILITRHDKIGDFITSLPLYYVVKKANPDSTIYALVSKVNVDLAKKIDFIDEVILYDKDHFWQTLKAVKAANINISISAFIDTKLGWMLFLSRIKIRIAPATKLAQLFFNKTLKQRRSLVEKTEVKYNLDLAKTLDEKIDLNYKIPLLELDNKQKFRNNNQLNNKKIVLFHSGYGGSSDGNLSLEDYVRLAEVVRGLHNIQVVWVFGPDDLGAKDKISALISDLDIMYQPPTVMDYCYLIRDSELLISTSTGPMHLAGALNIKTVSFFGSGLFASSKRWATVNDGDKQLNIEVDMHYQQDFLRKIIDLIIQKINL
jgi:ADP-heptose:LPS heptosyltransferase